MINKTIIDGIEVSKCEFFTPTRVTVLGGDFETQIYCGQVNEFSDDAFTKNAPNLHCDRCPNCYFKQIARAKEEIKKWKHQAELGSDTTDRLAKELQAKEQECEELKKDCPKRCKSDKYKQALDEIEHILETYSDDDWKATREIENIISKAKEEIENLRNLQDDLVARNKELQDKLNEIERLLKDALDAEKTNTDESFENFYKCLEIIEKTKEVE